MFAEPKECGVDGLIMRSVKNNMFKVEVNIYREARKSGGGSRSLIEKGACGTAKQPPPSREIYPETVPKQVL
jgi:hypothetical protein